jgi:hypothetical protein
VAPRDDARIKSPDNATAAKPALRKKRKKENDDDNNKNKNKNKNDDDALRRGSSSARETEETSKKIEKNARKKVLKARNRAHLLQLYSISEAFHTQNLNEGSDASASYFKLYIPTDEHLRERIKEEAEVEHELSSKVFIEVDGGEVLPQADVLAAIEQARTLPVAEGLRMEEYAACVEKLYDLAFEEYTNKENESDEELSSESESDEELSSESERAEEEKKDGFLFYPNSVIGCRRRAILHIFDNYPADNDVLSISESQMTILQEEDNLAVLGKAPFTQDLFGFRTSKEPDFAPEEWAQKTETLLATEAMLECIEKIVPASMVRYQDVAPFSDGTRRKKAKSLGCKPPEIMHEAGVESFVQHFSARPDTKTMLNLVRANDTSEAFFAAFALEQEQQPKKAMKLFKMKEKVDKNTGTLSKGTGNVGVYVLRERSGKDGYRYSWYFILPSPTLSTKALTVTEQTSALRDTLSVINEFLRLLGAKPWGVNVNPLTLKRGSGNLLRQEGVSMKRYRQPF